MRTSSKQIGHSDMTYNSCSEFKRKRDLNQKLYVYYVVSHHKIEAIDQMLT